MAKLAVQNTSNETLNSSPSNHVPNLSNETVVPNLTLGTGGHVSHGLFRIFLIEHPVPSRSNETVVPNITLGTGQHITHGLFLIFLMEYCSMNIMEWHSLVKPASRTG